MSEETAQAMAAHDPISNAVATMDAAIKTIRDQKDIIEKLIALLEECRMHLKHTCHERDAVGCQACSIESRIEFIVDK